VAVFIVPIYMSPIQAPENSWQGGHKNLFYTVPLSFKPHEWECVNKDQYYRDRSDLKHSHGSQNIFTFHHTVTYKHLTVMLHICENLNQH
jgi:hypothetical protein